MDPLSVTLYLGNCLNGLKHVDDGSVDLVITSPPYNIDLKSRNDYTENYFDNLPEEKYRARINALVQELHRVIKPRGSIWINMKSRWMDEKQKTVTASKGSLEPPMWLLDYTRSSLILKNLVIWNYDINSDTQNNKFHPRYEFFFWFVKDPKEYNFYIDRIRITPKTKDKRNNPLGANPSDVWYVPLVKGNAKERNDHPAQYPEALIERIILGCSNDGEVVLDPFLGSGTTLNVALKHGRNGIGFEIEEQYISNAKTRLDDTIKQMNVECNVIVKKI